ncbi:hypothetical protein [endosymbiont 'TC1' of Trimyema compressum]|uniref:hypothetical protein n=1 Tax=endosymbiont 'TC1' of Trimyema compressum TaxID=243899 RepID=UPI00139233B2|nr:hypothetical protein [endosymbiont 'TC1' of Trimyema compressum]
MADNSSVEAYLVTSRNYIREDVGDYEIISVENPIIQLKIKGKKINPVQEKI